MPSEAALTDLSRTFISWLPLALQRSPDHRAVAHAQAKELELLEARIFEVRAQFFPTTATILLKLWERLLRLTVEPEGKTYEERRPIVLATLRNLASTPEGRAWVANVTSLAGAGWTYQEHVPGDPASPPENTVRIELPYPPTSLLYQQLERLIRAMSPSHLDLIVTFSGGFVLDQSQLDQEELK